MEAQVTIHAYVDGALRQTIKDTRVVYITRSGYKINWLSGRRVVAPTFHGFVTADFATSMPAKASVMQTENEICTSLGIPLRWTEEQIEKARKKEGW